MNHSRQIVKNFSKSASKYANEAHVQKVSAIKLVELLKNNLSNLTEGKCLEIGCGTGFITEKILKVLPTRTWSITDLSQDMVNLCKKNMHKLALDNSKISFECFDGEQIECSNEYALIASGMTFQWFLKFAKSVSLLKDAVKPGGILCFSCLNQDSFKEWRSICKQINVSCSMIPLPSVNHISDLFADPSWSTHIETEHLKIAYTSAQAFFKHLKNIGANATSQKVLTTQEMRRLIDHWNHQNPLGISVTYSITYVVAKKTER